MKEEDHARIYLSEIGRVAEVAEKLAQPLVAGSKITITIQAEGRAHYHAVSKPCVIVADRPPRAH
jgi:hypothetical protein